MAKIDLTKYGITGTTEIVYNPSYEMLFMWAAAAPNCSRSLPCVAAVLLWGAVSMEVLQESGTAVLRAWHSAPGYCREADAVFPRSVSVRGQSLPCHSSHGGDRKGRTVCGALYTDAHAVRSQSAVL